MPVLIILNACVNALNIINIILYYFACGIHKQKFVCLANFDFFEDYILNILEECKSTVVAVCYLHVILK